MEITLEVDEQPVNIYLEGYSGTTYWFHTGGRLWQTEATLQDQNRCEFTLENRHYTIWISEIGGNQAYVSVGNHLFRLKRMDLLAEAVVASGFDRHGSDSNVVQTPMPGKVIKIMVSEGDEVKKGDGLMIIEAMKMENLITAPRDGIVKQLFITLSDRVESSKTVLELEP